MGRNGRRFFFGRLFDVTAADGKKRFVYSVVNIFLIALTVLFAGLFVYLVTIQGDVLANQGLVIWIAMWIGAFICLAIAVYMLLVGVVVQLVTLVCAIIGLFASDEKKWNAAALVVALLSLAAVAVFLALWISGVIFA